MIRGKVSASAVKAGSNQIDTALMSRADSVYRGRHTSKHNDILMDTHYKQNREKDAAGVVASLENSRCRVVR